jgi:two-component system sensor histidine kinase ComP
MNPEDLALVTRAIGQSVRMQTSQSIRFRFLHADGYPVYMDSLGTPVLGDDGKVDSIVVVSRDITEKIRFEKEIQESEQRYRRLLELSPQPIAAHHNGEFTYINQAGVRLLGVSDASGLIGKHILDFVHPDYWEVAAKRTQSVVKKKYNHPMEYQIVRQDGQKIEAEITDIYDEKTQSILSVFNDITERKNIERELQESEERYRRLVELSPVAIAVFKNDKLIYINPTGMKVVNAKLPEEIMGTSLLDWVHPTDRAFAKGRIDNILFSGYFSLEEIRIVRLDGTAVIISATAIYDPQSSNIQIVFEDITSRKQAEMALMESEELNRQLVELSPEAIVLHCDYKFTYVNPTGLKLFGASNLSDLIDRSIFDVIHPDYTERVFSRLADVYAKPSTTPHIEQKIVRFDGTIIDVEVIGTTIPYLGKNAGLTLFHDITERKKAEIVRTQAEQIIRESDDRYLRLHTSLDRFSHDLFGVLKVNEMEQRLIKEVREVLKATNVCLVELDENHDIVIKSGDRNIPERLLLDIATHKLLPVSEIIDTEHGCYLKIGEIKGKSYLLCIGEKLPLLKLMPKRVWLKTITRYVGVLYDNFQSIEDLTEELEQIAAHQIAPSWLLRFLFNLSENERKRLSQDLHDAALQEQIIWYRKLDQLTTDCAIAPVIQEQLQQITQGLLDVIYQIRITCNELRPPMLKEQGLVSSLEALFEFTQLRTNYSIQFEAADFRHQLSDDLLIGLYRIVQELLANATKHSSATQVHIHLASQPDNIELTYKDNGIGMDVSEANDLFKSMGVYGMKERVRSMDGDMQFHSRPNKGLSVSISIPVPLTAER